MKVFLVVMEVCCLYFCSIYFKKRNILKVYEIMIVKSRGVFKYLLIEIYKLYYNQGKYYEI